MQFTLPEAMRPTRMRTTCTDGFESETLFTGFCSATDTLGDAVSGDKSVEMKVGILLCMMVLVER